MANIYPDLPLRVDFDAAPALVTGGKVVPQWIDYNGHMNVAFYVLAFDMAIEAVCKGIGVGEDYLKRSGCSTFVLESRIDYCGEIAEGAPFDVAFQMLGVDEKRMHYAMTMTHATEGFEAAVIEQKAIHVDLSTRKVAPMPDDLTARWQDLLDKHGALPVFDRFHGPMMLKPPRK